MKGKFEKEKKMRIKQIFFEIVNFKYLILRNLDY